MGFSAEREGCWWPVSTCGHGEQVPGHLCRWAPSEQILCGLEAPATVPALCTFVDVDFRVLWIPRVGHNAIVSTAISPDVLIINDM